VTAPRPAPDPELTERLAAVLRDWGSLPPHACLPYAQREAVIAALLPVVQQYAAEKAAVARPARVASPAAVAGQGEELREALAAWLFDFTMGRDNKPWRWAEPLGVNGEDDVPLLRDETVRGSWRSTADALLAGPVAPLLAAQAAVERVRALHRPWYEINGVRHEHTVTVPCSEFAGCDGDGHRDCDASDGEGHEAPACSECRWSDGDVDGFLLWPCPTVRALDGRS
jgi:hypothetical protein